MEISTTLSYGILNWYPFRQGASVRFMGDCTEGFMEDIISRGLVLTENAPCDYVIAINLLERAQNPQETLGQCRKYLKPEGHLFLVCENRLGLRYFIGDRDPFTHRNFDGVEGYRNFTDKDREILGGRCYARYEIEAFLDAAGWKNRRGYSVLPGLEMPQQMYAWDYLPEENIAIRYTPLYHNPASVFLSEERLYDSIIQNGMFHQMANAYLIDCSMDGKFYEINHVTTSLDRGHENALATIIQKDGKVWKKALYKEGRDRIEALTDNMRYLDKRDIPVVGWTSASASGILMDYIKAPTALEYLRTLIYEDKAAFIEKVCQFLDLILASSEECSDRSSELGPIYEKVFIDMVPLNCFYKDEQFVFFDQEFVIEKYPIHVVLVRALDIIYMGDKSMEAIVPSVFFMKKYNLADKENILRAEGTKFIEKLRHREDLNDFHKEHMADAASINSNRQMMNYSPEEYRRIFWDFLEGAEEKDIYLFGSGLWARKFIAEYGDRVEIKGLLDNNEKNWGKCVDGIEVMNPREITEPQKCKIIICIKNYAAVLIQLEQLGFETYGIYDPYIERMDSTCARAERIPGNIDCAAPNETESGKHQYHTGYVAGVFDLFHIGHLNILKRAKEHCDYLIVGVVSDEQASKGKSRSPYVNERERLEIVKACRYVDEAFILPVVASGTRDVYKKYHFDVQFSGSDYEHDPNWLREQAWLRERGAELIFFPYTESTSSTKLKDAIEKNGE